MTKKEKFKYWSLAITLLMAQVAMVAGVVWWIIDHRVTVSFDLGLPELVENAEEFEPIKMWKGKVLEVGTPTMEVATCEGWLIKEGNRYIPFDISKPMEENVVLYANWVLKDFLQNNTQEKWTPDSDSDQDGASDEWEYLHGFDPDTYHQSFYVTEYKETIGESVGVQVELELTGQQAESLEISTAGMMDSPYLSPAIAGYMASAYDFSVDGEFGEAKITFTYDSNVYGRPSEIFQPRIYYVNEYTGALEELPNQEVSRGRVSVTVNHFSKYILLNKVEFDKVWEQDIKFPSVKGIGVDIVFALDNSASMTTNDSANLRYEVVNQFLGKLGQYDNAALLSFERQGHVLSQLTTDHGNFSSLMNGIVVDSGQDMHTSGTSSIAALRSAAAVFKGNEKYKIIVLISDGRDSGIYDEKKTTEVIEEMVKAGIVVYTVGVGDVDTTRLQQYADGTGGKYFYACTPEDLAAASKGFGESTEGKQEDLTLDSNKDGISDYYTQLILEGKLVFKNGSRELMNSKFPESADYDNDGLLNGEEIEIVVEKYVDYDAPGYVSEKIYMVKKSDMLYADSDEDDYLDGYEVENNMDPLQPSIDARYVSEIFSDDNYFYEYKYDEWISSSFYQGTIATIALYTGQLDRQDLYQNVLLSYFQDWAQYTDFVYQSNPDRKDLHWFLKEASAAARSGVRQEVFKTYDEYGLADMSDGVAQIVNEKQLNGFDTQIRFINAGAEDHYILHIKKHKDITWTKDFGDAMSIYSNAMTALDVMDRMLLIQEIARYYEVFQANIEFLDHIKEVSSEMEVRDAVDSVKSILNKDGKAQMEAVIREVVAIAVDEGIGQIYSKNPYTQIAKVLVDVFVVSASGVSKDITQLHEMILYHDMCDGAIFLFFDHMGRDGGGYDTLSGGNLISAKEAYDQVCRLRILAENKYYEYVKDDGWIKGDDPWEKDRLAEIIKNTALMMQYAGRKIPQTEMFKKIYETFGITF